ncbi:vitamin B12-dependent ribonucleotide reductase [Wukongibacter sp. M2B1]|uniref:vitamin B12-dependent ribonucleotide reductase n=1 Tax=Wukongibacter sp. M2B1 TaxID=3088895 RepID=UPI003D79BD6E
MELKNLVKRYYTKDLEDNPHIRVYDLFDWKQVDVKLFDYKTGKNLCDMRNLEFPTNYSQNACDIIASKYFRRAGVPNEYGYERSLKEVIHRLVEFWTASALSEGLLDEHSKDIFYDETVYMMLSQKFAPNSPQWFNTGLKRSYGINKEAEGHCYYDIEKDKVVMSEDGYTRTQGSACFITSINDSLLGEKSISDQLVTETRLFKHGSGTGTNFSSLRSRGERLSGGGTSSGLMSFLKVFDRNAGAIKSGGTTRRAAKIVCLDADHPEIYEFVRWKAVEEDKVAALGKMGYDIDFNGEAYETVSGQNSNNSVRFTHEFMRKVMGTESDTSWSLKGRADSSVDATTNAKELWKEFNYASWRCADPAPQFHDTINSWNTCPMGEDGSVENIEASNPCSEYHFLNDTACNLASINSVEFYDYEKNEFDIEGFLHTITLVQIILEATIHWGQFPTSDIARRSHYFRTTGLGIANTGALHMMMAHPYDSDEARAIGAALMGIITGQSYYVSSLMAKKVGVFPRYEINKEHMLKVLRNHCRAAGALNNPFENLDYKPQIVDHGLLDSDGFKDLSDTLKKVWLQAIESGEKYGYRNAQVSVVAPTGTISLAMDCTTTSIEPFFAHVVYKKLVGGGFMQIVNPYIKYALQRLDYSSEQISDIENYVLRKERVTENGYTFEKVSDGKIEGAPHLKKDHYKIFDTANICGTGKRSIEPMGHVKYVAALTPLVSGAISKTVNLPRSASIGDFENVHIKSWELGVKCIALYRDGCKASQPLNSSKGNGAKGLEDMSYIELLDFAKNLKEKYEEMKFKREMELAAAIDREATAPKGYREVTCSNCGSTSMVPNGTCHICLNCGSTTGCS